MSASYFPKNICFPNIQLKWKGQKCSQVASRQS